MKIKADKMCELEKFGFKENIFYGYIKFSGDTTYKLDKIIIDRRTRQIRREIKGIYTPQRTWERVTKSCIEDLIKADMVEE